jgi:methylisocitrate lyase
VVPADQFVQKLRAAERTRESMLIVARTDSRATHGLDEAIRRGRVYREAGADVIFPEALESEEEFTAYADAVGGPLMANMTEFGKTPYTSVDRFHAMGYGIVIFPVTALRVAAKAVEQALTELRDAGTQIGLVDRMQTRQELYRLIGYDAYETLDRRLSGD